jgi:hypothetical protein
MAAESATSTLTRGSELETHSKEVNTNEMGEKLKNLTRNHSRSQESSDSGAVISRQDVGASR